MSDRAMLMVFPSFSRRGGCAKRRRGGDSHRNVPCAQPPQTRFARLPLLEKEGNKKLSILVLIASIFFSFTSAFAQDVSSHRALIDRYCVTCHTQRQKDRG